MKHFQILLLIFALTISESFSQVKVSISDAVNVAGRQRMLGQRMAKDKVYITAHKHSKQAKKELKRSISTFQNALKVLNDFAPTDVIKQKVEIEEYVFNIYKTQILDNSKTSMEEIIQTNTLFLAICDDLVTEIIKYSDFKSSEEKNNDTKHLTQNVPEATGVAGKLRYLTQRLTLYYALNNFEIQKVSSSEIETIVKTMDKNLNYLTILEFNTFEISEKINEIRNDWMSLKKSIYKDNHINLEEHKVSAVRLYKTCNKILYKANITAKMYTELDRS